MPGFDLTGRANQSGDCASANSPNGVAGGAPAALPRGSARSLFLFGDIGGRDDGRRKGRNRKAQRNGQRRAKFAHFV